MITCYHCGLDVPEGTDLHAVIDGARQPMCCPGCVAVAELIVAGGLDNYYRYRQAPAPNPAEARPTDDRELERFDTPALLARLATTDADGARRATLTVEGMRCAACAWLVEKGLGAVDGVAEVTVNLAASRAELVWRPERVALSAVLAEASRLGYRARPYAPEEQEAARERESRASLVRLGVAGLGAMQVMMFAVGLYAGAAQGIESAYRDFLRWTSAIVATAVVLVSARPFFEGALRDLRLRRLGMDVPVALAIGLAFVASLVATLRGTGEVYFDSVCMFTFFLTLGRHLEMRARHRAGAAVEAAVRRAPTTANRLRDAEGASFDVVAAEALVVGDRVLVRPGETVPADGTIVEGTSELDESMLTGEHWPALRGPGDAVVGGARNAASALVVEVARTGADTVLASIVRMVDRAGAARPRIARLADRAATWFVPAVLVLAAATFTWWNAHAPERALWVTLSVLVVTCPCALSLATPAALAATGGGLLERGLLAVGAHVPETLARATDVVFDKTGTLTRGRLRRVAFVALADLDEAACLALAAAVEARSEHPIAAAFADAGTGAGAGLEVGSHRNEPGAGVEAVAARGRVRLGRAAWAVALSGAGVPAQPDGDATWILLADDNGALAWFGLEDSLRQEAASTVSRLEALGLRVHLVSGDGRKVVAAAAAALGISSALARRTPSEKLEFVQELQAAGGIVVMVGDGINDAPGLGAAEVSVAMGGGTQLAMGRADAVLLRDDLGALADALVLARKTRRVIAENLTWALAYNLAALPAAAAGVVAPWQAALGMSASSLLVVGNALRLGARRRARDAAASSRRPAGTVVVAAAIGRTA